MNDLKNTLELIKRLLCEENWDGPEKDALKGCIEIIQGAIDHGGFPEYTNPEIKKMVEEFAQTGNVTVALLNSTLHTPYIRARMIARVILRHKGSR